MRPGFGPAVERVERGDADIIVTADFSRFFRDIDIQRQVIGQIEAAGGELWTVSNGRISHETAEQELLANLQGAVSHYQRRYARDKSFLAVEIAIEDGKIPWSQTPPGYIRTKTSQLVPDPELRDVIVEAFERRAAGQTMAEVRELLRQHGIVRSPHGVATLLRDRLYVGEIHMGTHTPNLTAHEAIVPRKLFDAVQAIKTPRGRKPKSDRLLARLGVLRCASCGGRMVVGTQTSNGRSYPFYRCGHVREDCSQRVTISAVKAEQVVSDAVRAALTDATGHASDAESAQEAARDLEKAQAEYDLTLRSFSAAGASSEPAAIERLTQLREARDAARQRHEQALSRGITLSLNVSDHWDQLSASAKRGLIAATVDRVEVAPGRGSGRIAVTLLQ